MTTTTPAASQPTSVAAKVGQRQGQQANEDPGGFGRIMSAVAQGGDANNRRTSDTETASEEGRNTGHRQSKEGAHQREGIARTEPGQVADKARPGKDETDADDARDNLFPLVPFLTALNMRSDGSQGGTTQDASARAQGGKTGLGSANDHLLQTANAETRHASSDAATGAKEPAERLGGYVRVIDLPKEGEAPRAALEKSMHSINGLSTQDKPSQASSLDGERKRGLGNVSANTTAPKASDMPAIDAEPDRELGAKRGISMEQLVGNKERRDGDTSKQTRATDGRPSGEGGRPEVPNTVTPPLKAASPVVQAVAATPAWAAAIQRIATITSGMRAAAAPVQALKIQLHPAELGVVTANLRMADGQLSIEIDVDTQDAYLKLSSERDAISKALGRSGMSIDNVTINPPSAHHSQAARDAAGPPNAGQNPARQDFQGQGASGQSGNSGNASRDTTRDGRHESERISHADIHSGGVPSGNGVYI